MFRSCGETSGIVNRRRPSKYHVDKKDGTQEIDAMVRPSLGSLLRPLIYFLCSILLLIHRVHSDPIWLRDFVQEKLNP